MTSIFPTSQNKETFKAYLRTYKDKFSDNILSGKFEQISNLLNGYHNSLTNSTQLEVVLFDYGETVDVSTANNLLYIPGLENDVINLKNGSSTKSLKFISSGVQVDSINYTLGTKFAIGNKNYTVYGVGGILLYSEGLPTYNITPSATSVDEGDTVTFTVTTTNVTDNTTLYYTISGTVSSADFTDNTLSGSVVVNSNTATFTKTLSNDLSIVSSEGEENFTVSLRTDSTSGTIVDTTDTITVADTSTSSYTLTQTATSVDEGQSVSFTLTTTGIVDGTVLYYTTTGTASTTTDITALSGSFTINNNSGTFSINVKQDYEIDDAETLTVSVRVGSISGSIVATSEVVTIDDTPFTITIVPASTVIPESTINTNSTLSVDINTTDVADGTSFTAFINLLGSVTSSDFGQTSFPFTINNNTANISIPISRDARTEGTETFTISVKNQNNTVVATSPVIVITDSSFVGSRKTDKTFGPIPVNRDNGVDANASDWYELCGLDNVPNNSKISIFLDNSGSMTTNTVRASLNKLLIKLQQRNIELIVVENNLEDWITPFNVDLN